MSFENLERKTFGCQNIENRKYDLISYGWF